MVLWEITLGTAYFLGLKRTYRLALKIQRRIISPKHPKIREFALRRTRAVFGVALKVQRKVQETDIEAGRNLGNWILRWLDKVKPLAEIQAKHPFDGNASTSKIIQLTNSFNQKISQNFQKFHVRSGNLNSGGHLFPSSRNIWLKSFPTIAMMMRPPTPAGTNIHYRQFSISKPEAFKPNQGRFVSGMIREDVKQWLLHN